MKQLEMGKFAGNLKKCIAEYNNTHDTKFEKTFYKAYDDEILDLSDYNIIYRYTSGKKFPSLQTLVTLADLLGVTPDELLY